MKTHSLRLAKPRVYLETTIVSYLTSRPSRDLLRAARQEMTREWWNEDRFLFDLFVSEVVEQESSKGDKSASAARMAVLDTIPNLAVLPEAIALAAHIGAGISLPKKADADALHIAVAAVHNIEYLLSWNCKHIANQKNFSIASQICVASGYRAPILCTPESLPEN